MTMLVMIWYDWTRQLPDAPPALMDASQSPLLFFSERGRDESPRNVSAQFGDVIMMYVFSSFSKSFFAEFVKKFLSENHHNFLLFL